MWSMVLYPLPRSHNGKGYSPQQMALEKLDLHMQCNEVDPSHIPYTKVNSNRIKILTANSMTVLEENIEEKLQDTGFDNNFSNITPKHR
jgi:hypothetical protein